MVLQAQEGNVKLAMCCGQQPLRQLAPGGRITFSMAHISKTAQLILMLILQPAHGEINVCL